MSSSESSFDSDDKIFLDLLEENQKGGELLSDFDLIDAFNHRSHHYLNLDDILDVSDDDFNIQDGGGGGIDVETPELEKIIPVSGSDIEIHVTTGPNSVPITVGDEPEAVVITKPKEEESRPEPREELLPQVPAETQTEKPKEEVVIIQAVDKPGSDTKWVSAQPSGLVEIPLETEGEPVGFGSETEPLIQDELKPAEEVTTVPDESVPDVPTPIEPIVPESPALITEPAPAPATNEPIVPITEPVIATKPVSIPVGQSIVKTEPQAKKDPEPSVLITEPVPTQKEEVAQSTVAKPEPSPLHELEGSVYSETSELPFMAPSHIKTYTIPSGTILFHGTTEKATFDPNNIKLSDKYSVAFFSPDPRFAADYIKGCALYPEQDGHIHTFRVKKDVDKIIILSNFEIGKNWNLEYIEKNYCSGEVQKYGISPNGVGFFNPRLDPTTKQTIYIAEFAICNPEDFLTYESTRSCVSRRRLGSSFSFN